MAQLHDIATKRNTAPTSALMSSAELRQLLEAEHPIYTKNKKIWTDILKIYLNEDIDTFIYRHQREKEQNWLKRKERAYFFNYVQSIIDLITSFIYSKTIERYWESPEDREGKIRKLRLQQIQQDAQREQEQQQQETVDKASEQKRTEELAIKGVKVPTASGGAQQSSYGPPPKSPTEAFETELKVQQLINAENISVEELHTFWNDFDLRGTSIDDFSHLLCVVAHIFGHVDVFVDMPTVDSEIISERDRREQNIRAYGFMIFPLDLINWEIGEDGKFEWIRWREKIVGTLEPFAKRNKQQSWKYFTWTREEWFLHEIRYEGEASQPKAELVDQGENPLGEIPIARFFAKKHLTEPMIGISPVRDIAKINIEILNLSSLIDEEVYQKCLNILVMQTPAEKKGAIELGANNVLLWEGDHQPYYLAPASEPGSFMLELIKVCVQEIYRLAKLGGDTGVQEAQSGIAYTWEFNQTNRMLADKADQMERGENEVHRLWSKWMGLEWKGFINYPDDFNVEKFEEEVKRVVEVKQAVRSPEFKRLMEKRVASRALSKVSSVQRARVFAEIDVLDEEKPFQPFF